MSALTVIEAVQTLLDEIGSDDFDKDYVTRWLTVTNKDLEIELESLNIGFDTYEIVLPNVPANTTDLSPYQADGNVLANLMVPRAMRWRPTGQSSLSWVSVEYTDKLLDEDSSTTPGVVTSIAAVVASWTQLHGNLSISPCNIPVDLEIRGEFLPSVLDSDSASYIKGADNVLAYITAYYITMSRGGETGLPAFFLSRYEKIMDSFTCNLIKANQAKPSRLAGRRSQMTHGTGSGFPSPIA